MNHPSFRKMVGGLLGEVLIRLKPDILRDSHKVFRPTTIWQRLAKAAIFRRAIKTGNQSALEELHLNYWSSQAAESFFSKIEEGRTLRQLLNNHPQMIEWLLEMLSADPGIFRSVCELGSGNGKVLNHLAQTLDGIDTFTGIDLSERQTARTRETYCNTQLRFDAGDGLEWLEHHASPGMILSTFGGVFEYFTEARLQRVLHLLSTRAVPAAISLIEPLDKGFNLTTERHSRACGSELSFSHNYPLLIQQAGLRILHQQDATYSFGRRLMLLAVTPNC